MREKGFQCSVFAFSGRGEPIQYLDSHSRWKKTIYLLRAIFHFPTSLAFSRGFHYPLVRGGIVWGRFSTIGKERPTVIHIHHIQVLTKDFLNFIEFTGIPWVISLRGYETGIRPLLSENEKAFLVNILSRATGIHCVADNLKQRAIAVGAFEGKIVVIRRTVEVETSVIPGISFDEYPISLTCICRFNWKKGLVFLLQAIRKLLDKNIPVVLNICGSGNEKEELEIRYWIWLLNLQNHTILHGHLSSEAIDRVLQVTHIYVQPSINEGIPNTLLRVLSSRIPIVASAVDGIPEVVTHGVHGVLVPPGDADAIVNGVVTIINDRQLRENIGSAELKNVSTDFSVEESQLREFYSMVINRMGRTG